MTMRQVLKKEWNPASFNTATRDEISCGSLQRIADACELMARRYQDLIDDRDRYKRARDEWEGIARRHHRRVIALRGVVTRLKKGKARK